MPMLYVSFKVEPGDIILTTMLTYRHAINTVLANFCSISSGVWWYDWGGMMLRVVFLEGREIRKTQAACGAGENGLSRAMSSGHQCTRSGSY